MTSAVELQIISKILTSESDTELDRLCAFDESYYSVFKDQIRFILDHRAKYNDIPDIFTFQAEFPDVTLVQVNEPIEYLEDGMRKNKQHILLLETFNTLSDLGSGDVNQAWTYLSMQVDAARRLDSAQPMNLISDAIRRSEQVIEFNRSSRIPTGFDELDKLMYGGMSTAEELIVIGARTNSGKSWLCTKMMESAQKHGFPVLYYSPEMRASFIGTRFDTWRAHFRNSELFRGQYDDEYKQYLKDLIHEDVGAYVVEDSDMPDGRTTPKGLENLVKQYHIKLLIIDGLSYVAEDGKISRDTPNQYKNICNDLFRISKTYGCAVVVAMQANRETKHNLSDDGKPPFPTIYELEGSDHPGRIATQVFMLRQVFDKHVLDIRLEKSRNAKNERPTLSYVWDPNTGTTEYLPEGENAPKPSAPSVYSSPIVSTRIISSAPVEDVDEFDDDDDDIEF